MREMDDLKPISSKMKAKLNKQPNLERIEMAKKEKDRREQAEEILRMAEAKGVQNNFFFATTFERYLTQLDILDNLKIAIKEYGSTVTKEYVKGRENICVNPAITEYNKTSTACNGTVSTLINIIKSMPAEDSNTLADIMKGLMDE